MTLEDHLAADEGARAFLDAFRKMGEVERLIFSIGVRGLTEKVFDADGFAEWTGSRLDRHRSGEKLRLKDLELPPHLSSGETV